MRSSTAVSSFSTALIIWPGLARGPAIDAGHRILGAHRLTVVEFERVTQPESPDEAVRRDLFGLDHLALDVERGVHAVEHVPHQQAGVAGDVGRGPDRVEIG